MNDRDRGLSDKIIDKLQIVLAGYKTTPHMESYILMELCADCAMRNAQDLDSRLKILQLLHGYSKMKVRLYSKQEAEMAHPK